MNGLGSRYGKVHLAMPHSPLQKEMNRIPISDDCQHTVDNIRNRYNIHFDLQRDVGRY